MLCQIINLKKEEKQTFKIIFTTKTKKNTNLWLKQTKNLIKQKLNVFFINSWYYILPREIFFDPSFDSVPFFVCILFIQKGAKNEIEFMYKILKYNSDEYLKRKIIFFL